MIEDNQTHRQNHSFNINSHNAMLRNNTMNSLMMDNQILNKMSRNKFICAKFVKGYILTNNLLDICKSANNISLSLNRRNKYSPN